jgi:hypothetical protein
VTFLCGVIRSGELGDFNPFFGDLSPTMEEAVRP